MTKLSQWYALAEQTPWEVGVYKIPDRYGSEIEWFSYWCGESFHGGWSTIESAMETRGENYIVEYTKWRGLSTSPEVKKKQQNKRKTMYVVMNAVTNNPTASFFSVNSARDYAETVNFPVRVKKIRFRTPE